MDTETALNIAEEVLKPWARSVTMPEPNRKVFSLSRNDLKIAIKGLLAAHWGYLACIG